MKTIETVSAGSLKPVERAQQIVSLVVAGLRRERHPVELALLPEQSVHGNPSTEKARPLK